MQVIILTLFFTYFFLLLLAVCLYLLLAGPDVRAKRKTAATEKYLTAFENGKPACFAKIRRLGNCDEAATSLVKGYAELRIRCPERAEALLSQLYVLLAEKERRCEPSDTVGRLFYLRLLEELEPNPPLYEKRLRALPECLLKEYSCRSIAGK